jgi:thioredoxin-like negative regulator of GroEL
MQVRTLVSCLCFGALVVACSRQPTPPVVSPLPAAAPAVAAKHLPPGIPWFTRGVDAAFASAKSTGKPLFLYWGAEWCPPCAQIKATIFNRREFQERSRLFIPVYLDGDTPSAQKYGEKFGVVGYPTMILFRPDGTEITRLPGGVDISHYAKILDVALAGARPVADILRAASTGGDVSADDWRLLAFYSWSTDNGHVLVEAQRLATFRQLADRCPPELPAECSRLTFEYLAAAAKASTDKRTAIDGLERAAARRRLLALLAQPSVQQANVENLLYGATDIVGVLSEAGSTERRELTSAWSAALDSLAALQGAGALSAKEQINLVRARVLLAKLDAPKGPLPPALVEQARKVVRDVAASTADENTHRASVNAAVGLCWEAGLQQEGNDLLTAELDKSKTPYYFMLDLAELAEKAGHKDVAVQWLARAYQSAKGPATRFQWGYDYLVGLLEMTPQDTKAIERAGLDVLGELDAVPDAFYQRTRLRLEQLSGRLLEWGKTGAEPARVVGALRARSAEICSKLPQGDEGRRACEGFLKAGELATPHA